MNTIRFTDNRPIHKVVLKLTSAQVAAHLLRDQQFVFYWRKGWDPRLAATRSLYADPVSPDAIVAPRITVDQWQEIDAELHKLFCHDAR